MISPVNTSNPNIKSTAAPKVESENINAPKNTSEKYDFKSLNEQKIEKKEEKIPPKEKLYTTGLRLLDNEFTKLLDKLAPVISIGISVATIFTGTGIIASLGLAFLPFVITKLNSMLLVPWLNKMKDQGQDKSAKIDLNRDLVFDNDTKRDLFYKIKQFLGYKSSLQTESLAKSVGTSSGNLLILHGPPGTGKSAIAEGVAGIAKKPLIKVNVNDIESKWIGESEAKIAAQFKVAKKLGAYLFFDEADALLMARPENSDSGGVISQAKITNTFIQNFNDYKDSVKVILATNTANSIDNAIKSRAILCQIPAPNTKMQLAILYRKLKDFGLNEERLNKLKAEETKIQEMIETEFSEFTGRDIESGVKSAFFIAEEKLNSENHDHSKTELSLEDLKQAFSNLRKEKDASEVSSLKPLSKNKAQQSKAVLQKLLGI